MSDPEPDGLDERALLYPFVVVASQGGPFDDAAFVAGAQFGHLAEKMSASGGDPIEAYVHTEIVPQLDLAAMHSGWSMAAEPWEDFPDQWTFVAFTRPA